MKRSLSSRHGVLLAQGLGLALVVGAAVRCSSPAPLAPPPGDDGGSGSTSGSGSSGDTSGSGSGSTSGDTSGSTSGSGSSGSSGASSGSVPPPPPCMTDAGTCCVDATQTLGVHIRLPISWPGVPLVLNAGSGTADIWLLSHYTINGTAITGTSKTCGLTLPDVQLGSLENNAWVKLNLDDTIWDKPMMPTFQVTGTQSGFDVGATITINPAVGLLGIAPTSPYASVSKAWPPPSQQDSTQQNYPQFMPSDLNDPDQDNMLGIPVVPFKGTMGGKTYVLVPTQISVGFADVTDRISIVSRNQLGFTGTVKSCGVAKGTADVKVFENHIVACHDAVGTNCAMVTNSFSQGPGFVDANRTIFVPGTGATYTAIKLADGASCADVRAMVTN